MAEGKNSAGRSVDPSNGFRGWDYLWARLAPSGWRTSLARFVLGPYSALNSSAEAVMGEEQFSRLPLSLSDRPPLIYRRRQGNSARGSLAGCLAARPALFHVYLPTCVNVVFRRTGSSIRERELEYLRFLGCRTEFREAEWWRGESPFGESGF
ncbi:hypothetical protein K0M31_005059 [Melipona bicolor]|uniref:Uncharacterized protein n=1 Tax=Melipona bicolor TaxID=60889 RepID=A0AA40FW89_9HYME|nr:hypothetical protein K0M31_005059 [Melipona bicolor]